MRDGYHPEELIHGDIPHEVNHPLHQETFTRDHIYDGIQHRSHPDQLDGIHHRSHPDHLDYEWLHHERLCHESIHSQHSHSRSHSHIIQEDSCKLKIST